MKTEFGDWRIDTSYGLVHKKIPYQIYKTSLWDYREASLPGQIVLIWDWVVYIGAKISDSEKQVNDFVEGLTAAQIYFRYFKPEGVPDIDMNNTLKVLIMDRIYYKKPTAGIRLSDNSNFIYND